MGVNIRYMLPYRCERCCFNTHRSISGIFSYISRSAFLRDFYTGKVTDCYGLAFITEMEQDEETRKRFGENGRAYALKFHSLEFAVQAFDDMLNEAVELQFSNSY